MATTYTVKSGDTLSGIGQRLGVDWRKITGYRSGNPNLIYPGEKLTIPGAAPKPAAKPAAKEASTPTYIKQQYAAIPKAKVEAEKQAGIYEESVKAAEQPLIAAEQALIEQLQGRSNLEDLYNQLREERGVATAEGVIRGLQQQAIDVEGLMSALPENILERVRGQPVTEAQRQAVLARELEPLQTNLESLLRGAERERSGLDLIQQGITEALGIRQAQEAREAEPFQLGVEFGTRRFETAVDTAKSRLANVLAGAGVDIDTAKSLADTMINYRVTTEQRAHETALQRLQNQAALESARISAGSAIRAAEISAAATREAGNLFGKATEEGKKTVGQQGFREAVTTWPSGTTLKNLMANYAQFYPDLKTFMDVYNSLSPWKAAQEDAKTLNAWWKASGGK